MVKFNFYFTTEYIFSVNLLSNEIALTRISPTEINISSSVS